MIKALREYFKTNIVLYNCEKKIDFISDAVNICGNS
jgi:hypothetical protein